MFATIAEFFGISVLRLAIYAGCIALALGGAVAIRQHYINKGYASAIAAVKKQDDRAVAAADKVKKRADECAADSWWDVVSQSCKLEDAQ
jgi:hypothetical protein